MRGSRHNINRDEYLTSAILYAPRGTELPHAKLNDQKVRELRAKYRLRVVTAKDLAAEYGVHVRTIEKVLRFESWRHVR